MNTMMESLGLLEVEMTKYYNNIGKQLGKIGGIEKTLIHFEDEKGKLEKEVSFLGKRVGKMQEVVDSHSQLFKWKEDVDSQLFKWKEDVDLRFLKLSKDVARVIISLKGLHSTLIGMCKEEIDDNKVHFSLLG